jgi:hypothetical protein
LDLTGIEACRSAGAVTSAVLVHLAALIPSSRKRAANLQEYKDSGAWSSSELFFPWKIKMMIKKV